jgi:twitching motility protein PilT
MSDLLQLVVSEGAADLHLRVGVAPVIRLHGVLHRVEGPALRPEDTEDLMRSITSEDHIQNVRERGGADFGFAFGDMARFRVSVFKEKGNFGLVLRLIPNTILTMEQIGLPPSVKELLYRPRGLVLVTGPTGSGKTTTLASMINIINEVRDDAHIITVEDPIEYYHTHKKAVVTQREVNALQGAQVEGQWAERGSGHDHLVRRAGDKVPRLQGQHRLSLRQGPASQVQQPKQQRCCSHQHPEKGFDG